MSKNLNERLPETDPAEATIGDSQAVPKVYQRSDRGLIDILERMDTDVRAERELCDCVHMPD